MTPQRTLRDDFAAAFIPSQIGEDGQVEVLVIRVHPISLEIRREPQIKMPGGCAETAEEQTSPHLTLRRELRDEIGANDQFGINIRELVFERKKPGRTSAEPDHWQRFYRCIINGDLRAKEMIEDEEDEVLDPPFWMEARELRREIFWSHQEPLIEGLKFLAKDSELVQRRYGKLF